MSQIAGPFVYGHLESLSCACIAGRIALGGLKTCPPTDGDQALYHHHRRRHLYQDQRHHHDKHNLLSYLYS